jgi:transcription elongation factor Elf1
MGIRKSKKVKVTWEQHEITYDVVAECPYCGEVIKHSIIDDVRDETECFNCEHKFIIDISKLIY